MNRPMHIGGLVWALATAVWLGLSLDPLVGLAVGLPVMLIILFWKKHPFWMLCAGVAFVLCMLCLLLYESLWVAPAAKHEGTLQTVHGVVIEQIDELDYSPVTIRLTGDKNPTGLENKKVQAVFGSALDVSVGDVIEYKAKLSCTQKQKTRYYAKDICLSANPVGDIAVVGKSLTSLDVRLWNFRERAARNITRNLTGEEGAVLAGMLIGKTERISPVTRNEYARAGISHYLAVSGLHMAVVVGTLEQLLKKTQLSRRQRSLAILAGILAFMGITGFSYSVMRAGIMMMVCVSAGMFGRDSDTLNSLGFALVIILLRNPYAIFSLSLQLSYLSTMGIAAFASPMAKAVYHLVIPPKRHPVYGTVQKPKIPTALQAVTTTVSATVMSAPVICWNFGQISLVSIFANLLTSGLASVALCTGLLASLCGFLSPDMLLARILALAAGIAVKLINQIAAWFSRFAFAAVSVGSDPVIFGIAAALLLWSLLAAIKAPKQVKGAAAVLQAVCLVAVSVLHMNLWKDPTEIAAVSYGNCVMLSYKGQGVLIGAPKTVYTAQHVNAYFSDRGVKQIVLFLVQQEEQALANPAQAVSQEILVQNLVGLDQADGFSAAVFGDVMITAEGKDAKAVRIELDGFLVVKAFEQAPYPAHLLINKDNEMAMAPGVELTVNDRYFNSKVISLQRSANTNEIQDRE